jgi:menaquinone-dependent protoporphyrinogen oxidase
LMLPHRIAGASSGQASPEFIESPCGKDDKMKKRVLIAYASKCGSTGTVAEAIGQSLCGMGASVDVRLAGNVNDLSPYQAVIAGSAIRMGKWLPEAADFMKKNRDALSHVPCAYFVVCLTMKDDTPENRTKVMAYLDPVRKESPKVRPAAIGLFPGAVNFGKLAFAPRTILKVMGAPEGDYRNWPAVKAWAAQVGPALLAGVSQGASIEGA